LVFWFLFVIGVVAPPYLDFTAMLDAMGPRHFVPLSTGAIGCWTISVRTASQLFPPLQISVVKGCTYLLAADEVLWEKELATGLVRHQHKTTTSFGIRLLSIAAPPKVMQILHQLTTFLLYFFTTLL